MSGAGIRTLDDVLAIEAAAAELPTNTYDMLRRGMERDPPAKALSFFLRTEDHRKPEVWTYAALFAAITQTANLFHSLGIGRDDCSRRCGSRVRPHPWSSRMRPQPRLCASPLRRAASQRSGSKVS